ncbi:MAG: putative PEP-binding protein [Sulfurimonas sp.]
MKLFKKLLYKPRTIELTVTSANGFHLRPIAQFAALSKTFASEITAEFNGRSANAKMVHSLLSLSLETEDRFTLVAHGRDAREANSALRTLFAELMQNDETQTTLQKEERNYRGEQLAGEVLCEGIAIAPLYHLQSRERIGRQNSTFDEAVENVLKELETLSAKNSNPQHSPIFLAQHALLVSLKEKCSDMQTLQQQIRNESKTLEGGQHQAKIADYRDLLRRINTHLDITVTHSYPEDAFILIADEMLPSELETLQQTSVQGVILKSAAPNSHIAVLLRAAKIPAVIADALHLAESEAILDAYAGTLVFKPTGEDIKQAQERYKKEADIREDASAKRFEPALTSSGKRINVYANVTDTASAETAREEGAEGIGLLRTEFLFTHDNPSLEKQIDAYKTIFDLFDDVTVRTLDVGGDKALPYIDIPSESNPFLGVRGVRLFQTHPEIMGEQLQAIFAAAQGKPLRIMFPMVSTIEEFTEAKDFAREVAERHGLDISNIRFGIMVEVPSVLFLIEQFNKAVDFYSIGTNDLTQYLFAVERTHPLLKTDPHSPVLFDAIKTVVERAEKPVSLCGELAGDKKAIARLIGIGIETLSVSGKHIAHTKQEVRNA